MQKHVLLAQKNANTNIPKKPSFSDFRKIHKAPIILVASKHLSAIQYHPLNTYRVFKTQKDGSATPIPFQIDEKDQYGDYILGSGPNPNTKFSNGVFDDIDELTFMGSDVGPSIKPSRWSFRKPDLIYEVTLSNKDRKGSVFIGVYRKYLNKDNRPPSESLDKDKYVIFNLAKAQVNTSKYRYTFNKQNYLVVNDVFMHVKKTKQEEKLLDSSTFYLKTDFKYFLTFNINQSDIESDLDAYKSGAIRTIARVNFTYKFLKMNIDLGMYTEVSFFSNAVILPAVIDNPLDGEKTLNPESLFYYGFALVDNPETLEIESNMPDYKNNSLFENLFSAKNTVHNKYWLTAKSEKYMLYLEFEPSKQMIKTKNIPMFFTEKKPASEILKRPVKAKPLGESQVNVAVAFNVKNLSTGLHDIQFRLFIENNNKEERLNQYKTLSDWNISTKKI